MAKSHAGKTLKIFLVTVTIVLSIAIAFALLYEYLPAHPVGQGTTAEAKHFTSKEELDRVLSEYSGYFRESFSFSDLFSFGCSAPAHNDSTGPADMPLNSESVFSDYSETNTQVKGLDESDIVKTDGKYIYTLNKTTGVTILSASDGSVEKLSYIPVSGTGIYVTGDFLTIIGNNYDLDHSMELFQADVYDIADRAAPKLITNVLHEGSIVDTRMIGNKLYYILRADADTVPYVGSGEVLAEGDYSDSYYFEGINYSRFTTIGCLSLDDGLDEYRNYLGAGNTVYMSRENIYIAATDNSPNYYTNGLRYYIDHSVSASTRVLKFDANTLEFIGCATVPGTLNDRFSMDEYNGYFRIATTEGSKGSSVRVYNESLELLGAATGIAPGERIYSARFDGDTANIVTFLEVDPLFKVDLTDPENITVSDGLKKEGVSYYLHYIEGTDLLIGLGRDTSNGLFYGLEVALFDNSGEDAVLINSYIIGDYSGYSEALYAPQSILYDKERDLFGFSTEVFDPGTGENVYTYYVFGFLSGKLELRAAIKHSVDMDSRYEFIGPTYENYNYAVSRAVQIGDYLYAISGRLVTAHSIDDDFAVTDIAEI